MIWSFVVRWRGDHVGIVVKCDGTARPFQILMEIGGWEALPLPQWLKSSIRFAQQGKIQLAVCFVVGLIAFPFALVGFILLLLWRVLRARLRR